MAKNKVTKQVETSSDSSDSDVPLTSKAKTQNKSQQKVVKTKKQQKPVDSSSDSDTTDCNLPRNAVQSQKKAPVKKVQNTQESSDSSDSEVVVKKTTIVTKKQKKASKADDSSDDSSDEEVVVKKTVKTNVQTAAKPNKKKASKTVESSDDSSDSEEEVVKKPVQQKKVQKSKKMEVEDDSSDDDSSEEVVKKPVQQKKVQQKEESSDDDDSEEEEVVVKPAAKKQQKKQESSDDDDSEEEEEEVQKKPVQKQQKQEEKQQNGNSGTLEQNNGKWEAMVRGISYEADENDLGNWFEEKGASVEAVKLLKDRETGRSRGMAFITFEEEEGLRTALGLNNSEHMGRTIFISNSADKSRPQQQGGQQGGRGGALPEGAQTCFVGNLSYKCTDNDLKAFFKDCGGIIGARIATSREDGRSRGFGHVDFENKDAADNALKLNGQDFQGRQIKVDLAEGRKGGAGGAPRGGRGGSRGGLNLSQNDKAAKKGNIVAFQGSKKVL